MATCSMQAFASWQRSVTNYPRREYHSGNQNWMASQHKNGWMYFANNKGLLEFDGVEWNTYSIHNAKARAVKTGDDGRIYVGGMEQFGYFTPDRTEGLRYVCLSDSVVKDTDIGVVWNIHVVDNQVYFQADWRLFRLEDGKVEVIRPGNEIKRSAVIHNKFYIATKDGLSMLNGGEFIQLSNTAEIGPHKIVELLPFGKDVLVVTSRDGLFVYDGYSLTPYSSAANSFIHDNLLFCAGIKGDLLVLGSVQDGVLLLDTKTNETEHISTGNGLQNKTVLGISFDRDSNLWLGLDNGIDCVHLEAPLFSLYGDKLVIGSGYASYCYNGSLYLGTNQGLYRTGIPSKMNIPIDMESVPGTEGQVWSLAEYEDKLFCSSDNGVFIIDGKNISHLSGIAGVWRVVQFENHPDKLIAGTYKGLYLLQKVNNKWQVHSRLKDFVHSCKSMCVENSNTLWVANKGKGIYRLVFSDDLERIEKTTNYNSTALSPNNNVGISKIDEDVVVAAQEGVFKYDQIKAEFVRHTSLESLLEGRKAYTYISPGDQGSIWYVTDGVLKVLRYNPVTKSYYKNPNEAYLRGALIENFEDVFVCKANQAIIGTGEGFSILKLDKEMRREPLNLQIRKVYLTGVRDSLIYNRISQGEEELLTIPYRSNSLRIEYGTTNYDKSLSVLYSYRLSGTEEEAWSEYSENNTKEYTDLKEGKYSFSVKLITDKDEEPVVASFFFEVLPPWYRTVWAYLTYTLLAVVCLYCIYVRLEKSRKRLIRQKELELQRQQQTFQQVSDRKDKEIDTLKEEKLQTELHHKSEELARTTLNIVRKNEILQEIKKNAISITYSIKDENLVDVRRKTLRLISQIDTNIEHDDDLQHFQGAFDSVHRDFFRRLDEKFPELSSKDKMLCAYIKMNLMSKEIAPMLNISLRGVEVNRYRLRKKLGLGEKDNLTEFLQRLSK